MARNPHVAEAEGRLFHPPHRPQSDRPRPGHVGAQISGPQPAHAHEFLQELVDAEEGAHVRIVQFQGIGVALPPEDVEVVAHGAHDEGLPGEALHVDPLAESGFRLPHVDAGIDVPGRLRFRDDTEGDARGQPYVLHQLFHGIGRRPRGRVGSDHHGPRFALHHQGDLRPGHRGQEGRESHHQGGDDASLAMPPVSVGDRSGHGSPPSGKADATLSGRRRIPHFRSPRGWRPPPSTRRRP